MRRESDAEPLKLVVLALVAATVTLSLRGNPGAFVTFAGTIAATLLLDRVAPRVRFYTCHPEVWPVGLVQGRWRVVDVVDRGDLYGVVCVRARR